MLSHILANNPRVQYDHQTDLIGPDYTLLTLLSNMLSQYDTWYTSATPLTQMTDVSEAQVLAEQSAWSAAQTAGTVTASEQNGVVTIKNTGTGAVGVPVTVPPGTTVGGSAFGSRRSAGPGGRHGHDHLTERHPGTRRSSWGTSPMAASCRGGPVWPARARPP